MDCVSWRESYLIDKSLEPIDLHPKSFLMSPAIQKSHRNHVIRNNSSRRLLWKRRKKITSQLSLSVGDAIGKRAAGPLKLEQQTQHNQQVARADESSKVAGKRRHTDERRKYIMKSCFCGGQQWCGHIRWWSHRHTRTAAGSRQSRVRTPLITREKI